MTESLTDPPHDLIRLSGDDGSICVRVLGRTDPGVLPSHDYLDVEFAIDVAFLTVRLPDVLTRFDLERWSSMLDTLAEGAAASWRDDGRATILRVAPWGDGGGANITVVDDPASGIEMRMPLRLPITWVEEQRDLLAKVLQLFPAEVLESSPGVYKWASPRKTSG